MEERPIIKWIDAGQYPLDLQKIVDQWYFPGASPRLVDPPRWLKIIGNYGGWGPLRMAILQYAIYDDNWEHIEAEWFLDTILQWRDLNNQEDRWWFLWKWQIDFEERQWQKILEEWGRLIKEERDVIWQRELIAWSTWLEGDPATKSINDLKNFLGSGNDYGRSHFNSEGCISVWQQRWAEAWLHHVREPKRLEAKEKKAWSRWLTAREDQWDRDERNKMKWEFVICKSCGDILPWPYICQCERIIYYGEDGFLDDSHIHVQMRSKP